MTQHPDQSPSSPSNYRPHPRQTKSFHCWIKIQSSSFYDVWFDDLAWDTTCPDWFSFFFFRLASPKSKLWSIQPSDACEKANRRFKNQIWKIISSSLEHRIVACANTGSVSKWTRIRIFRQSANKFGNALNGDRSGMSRNKASCLNWAAAELAVIVS